VSELSVIAANHRVVGTISAAEDLLVQGRVEGRILSDATLVIDASAIVEGEIHARHVIVRGVVVGDVSGVDQIEVAPTGQILGDLKTRRLALKAGGRVSGLVHTGIEVPAYAAQSTARAAQGTWRGSATAARPAAPARSWPEEVVETGPRTAPASNAGAGEARKAKKEPSREAI
jgi:cytoskeletal protein CcmA (bactofilin family)